MDYYFPSKLMFYLSSKLNIRYKYYPFKFYFKYKSNRKDTPLFIEKIKNLSTLRDNAIEQCSDVKEIIKDADNAINRIFSVLGSEEVHLDEIEWNKDIKTNFIWENKFYKDIQCVNISNLADVKVPWEISRCHHFLYLGEAYLLTAKEKYAKEVVIQIKDWIKKNPVMHSVNWTCTMEVAIRAVNWLYSLSFIAGSGLITESFSRLVQQSLYEHGAFIFKNLERNFAYNANHYSSNIAGLLYLGWLFKETKQGGKWFDFAIKEFKTDIRLQILPSGMHYERSISYHRLMAELYLYPLIFLDHIGYKITDLDISYRVKKMLDFVDIYTKGNGYSPLIGDNDNGRFLPFVKRNFLDHRYLLSVGSAYFKVSYINQSKGIVDTFCLNLKENTNLLLKGIKNEYLFDDAGICFIKRKHTYLAFYNTGISRYIRNDKKVMGTHTHLDALSFELCYKKLDFIVDPGSYVYTASKKDRDKFVSTRMHNTAVIDDENQYQLTAKYFFNIDCKSIPLLDPQLIFTDEKKDENIVTSSFTWNLNNSLVNHRREIKIGDDAILIHDSFNSTNSHIIKLYFHFHPDVQISKKGCTFYLQRGGVILKMQIDSSGTANLFDDFVSFSYGIKKKAKVLCYCVQLLGEKKVITKIGEFI